jgi:hypothetical protein
VSYARRQWHPAVRVVLWLLASVTMHEVALGWALMRVPAVLLEAEWQEQRAKRLSLQSGGHSHGNAAWQYAQPSLRALVGAPPSANALSDPETEMCRRECSRWMSRSPPYICSSHHLGFFSCQGFDSQTMARAQEGG